MYFIIGDYLAGMLIGALTALGVRGLVPSGMDMVVGMLIGIYGGMLFGMRDAMAAGTGNDFQFLPPGHHIDAIDISPKMLERAAEKVAAYHGTIALSEMDVCKLALSDASFDTIATVCTFCSVPRPVVGLRELHRVLRPGGQLLMFEHVRSKIGPLAIYLDLITPWARRYGPDLNRDTVGNVERAGFRIRREENVYLDIVKIIEATR